MKNPFLTYGYNGPAYFCDREKETKRLTSLLQNGNHVALMSPRRMGKTGLIRHCFAQKKLQGTPPQVRGAVRLSIRAISPYIYHKTY